MHTNRERTREIGERLNLCTDTRGHVNGKVAREKMVRAIFWGNPWVDVCLPAVHGCGCCLCRLHWMLTGSLRSCGRAVPAAWAAGLHSPGPQLTTCFGQEVAGQRCCARQRPKEVAQGKTDWDAGSWGFCPAPLPSEGRATALPG